MSLLAAVTFDRVNDTVTAVLVIAVSSVLRGMWSMQKRVSRLEALDEARERPSRERQDEPPQPPYDQDLDR